MPRARNSVTVRVQLALFQSAAIALLVLLSVAYVAIGRNALRSTELPRPGCKVYAVALIGMGISSLSMAARAVRPVGAQLGRVTLETCEAAAEAALGAADPMAGRAAVRELLGH